MSETAPEATVEDEALPVEPVEATAPAPEPEVFEPMDIYKPSGSVDPEPEKPAVHTADWVASNGVLYCPICGLPAPCPSAPVVEAPSAPPEGE